MTKEEFLKKAHAIYGDKYCYERTILGGHTERICVTCKEHGDWFPVRGYFLRGHGCPVCARLQNKDLVFGIGINDEITPTTKCHKAYNHWQMILKKCFDQKYKTRHPTYKNVTMCEEWKRFSVFKKWFDANYVEGYDLDKDLLSDNGHKIYSPDTCCFIPHSLNVLLSSKKLGKDGLPRGINKEGNSYAVRVCLHKGERIRVGKIRSIDEAVDIYNKIKRKEIVSAALGCYENGLIGKRVYDSF